MNILCHHCGKDSGVRAVRNDGTNALNLKKAGFIAKFPILLGLSEWMFTCSETCHQKHLQRLFRQYNITDEIFDKCEDDLSKIKQKLGL